MNEYEMDKYGARIPSLTRNYILSTVNCLLSNKYSLQPVGEGNRGTGAKQRIC